MSKNVPHARFEQNGGVAVVTLSRPEVRNAYSGRMGAELGVAYRRCDDDDSVRVVVVTGEPPAFCSGVDMTPGGDTFAAPVGEARGVAESESEREKRFSAGGVDPPAWTLRKPVIAAVNGHAVGIGLTLALQCDFRIMAADAKYGVVQVRRGVMPDAFSHWTLVRLAGLTAAADVLLTGRLFDGAEALRLGIASRCEANDEVLPTALALAEDIATNTAPLAVAVSKRLLWESFELDAAGVGHSEDELHKVLMGHPDAREGVLAYLDRRPPRWRGSVAREWPEWPSRPDRRETPPGPDTGGRASSDPLH